MKNMRHLAIYLLLGFGLSACSLIPEGILKPDSEQEPVQVPTGKQQNTKQPKQTGQSTSGSKSSNKTATPTTPKAPAKVCGLELDEPRKEAAAKYYVKGERLFTSNNVEKAKKMLETAVCLDPEHKQADHLLNLLNQAEL